VAEAEVEVIHEFRKGDTDTTRDYVVKRAGSVVDLTDYGTPILYARNQTTKANLAAINGSIPTPSGGLLRFDHDTMAAIAGEYLCDILLVHSVNGNLSIRRSFKNIVRPSVHDAT